MVEAALVLCMAISEELVTAMLFTITLVEGTGGAKAEFAVTAAASVINKLLLLAAFFRLLSYYFLNLISPYLSNDGWCHSLFLFGFLSDFLSDQFCLAFVLVILSKHTS